ncbi:MAG: OprO/OprP family phosphate-selective porin [Cytophagaceae bacterium]|jgi:hypothetical protein|nr:OprO/OprP family phosphate-selective porin [Cytophagaceae bacterium]
MLKLVTKGLLAGLLLSTIGRVVGQVDSTKSAVPTVVDSPKPVVKKQPVWSFKSGIGITAPDSLFSVNFRFRMQNRFSYLTRSAEDWSADEIEARVRRLRLRLDGFVVNPKLTYYIQLSFSRGDMDWTVRENNKINSSPNIVRDAVIFYKPNHHWTFAFGQTKLPGNRQRVVSSGELQFADRSIVNSTFNIDRDFGFFATYESKIGKSVYLLKGALTSGEGRNSVISNQGMAYTGRFEFLPFGKFNNRGDYYEGDLEREQKPKVSLAAGYHLNESAARQFGTLGKDLYANRTMTAFIADALFKYKGFALYTEYINRNASNPVTYNSSKTDSLVIYTGYGMMAQASFIFKNNVEIAGRVAQVTPYKSVQTSQLQLRTYTLGVTKYLNKHRVKLQGNISYETDYSYTTNQSKNAWLTTFQIELGI